MKYEKEKPEPRFAVVAWALIMYIGIAAVIALMSIKGCM